MEEGLGRLRRGAEKIDARLPSSQTSATAAVDEEDCLARVRGCQSRVQNAARLLARSGILRPPADARPTADDEKVFGFQSRTPRRIGKVAGMPHRGELILPVRAHKAHRDGRQIRGAGALDIGG